MAQMLPNCAKMAHLEMPFEYSVLKPLYFGFDSLIRIKVGRVNVQMFGYGLLDILSCSYIIPQGDSF